MHCVQTLMSPTGQISDSIETRLQALEQGRQATGVTFNTPDPNVAKRLAALEAHLNLLPTQSNATFTVGTLPGDITTERLIALEECYELIEA